MNNWPLVDKLLSIRFTLPDFKLGAFFNLICKLILAEQIFAHDREFMICCEDLCFRFDNREPSILNKIWTDSALSVRAAIICFCASGSASTLT